MFLPCLNAFVHADRRNLLIKEKEVRWLLWTRRRENGFYFSSFLLLWYLVKCLEFLQWEYLWWKKVPISPTQSDKCFQIHVMLGLLNEESQARAAIKHACLLNSCSAFSSSKKWGNVRLLRTAVRTTPETVLNSLSWMCLLVHVQSHLRCLHFCELMCAKQERVWAKQKQVSGVAFYSTGTADYTYMNLKNHLHLV